MVDIRELESKWRASGDHEDHGRYLSALVQLGRLSQERLEVAAGLGHAGALASSVTPRALPQDYRRRIEEAVSLLTPSQAVEFSIECANRVLSAWEERSPGDARPKDAVMAARQSLVGESTLADVKRAGEDAAQAAIEMDDPNFTEDQDPERARAIHSANSASHAALAAEYYSGAKARRPIDFFDESVSYAADFALHASVMQDEEQNWQISLLAEKLICTE